MPFNQKLTALNRRTPFEAILDAYRENDSLFIQNPHELSVGRNNYGLSRLPKDELSTEKKPFKQYNIGYVHVDITELHCETGKWYLFVAIDRLTKYVYVELHQRMTAGNAVYFLRNLQAECVFKITHILTDNGAQFTYKLLPEKNRPATEHPFDAQCKAFGIEHRTTKFRHPWTNGQVEITNKIIKQATTKQFHYADPKELKVHLMTFLMYYNHQRPLKSLKLKTPWGLIEECYNQNPEFLNPTHSIRLWDLTLS